jgi:hypothetical protein
VDGLIYLLPGAAWYLIWVAIFTRMLFQGQTIQLPKWNWKQWLLINTLLSFAVAFYFLAGQELPKLVGGILFISAWKFGEVCRALIECGKTNLKQEPEFS